MEFFTLHRLPGVARACLFSITRVVGRRGTGSMARRGPRAGAGQRVPRRARDGARSARSTRAALPAGGGCWQSRSWPPRPGCAVTPGSPPGPGRRQKISWRFWGIRFRRPSEKTFRAVLSRVDPADLDARLGAYFTALATAQPGCGALVPVALDGKTLRGAQGLRPPTSCRSLPIVPAWCWASSRSPK